MGKPDEADEGLDPEEFLRKLLQIPPEDAAEVREDAATAPRRTADDAQDRDESETLCREMRREMTRLQTQLRDALSSPSLPLQDFEEIPVATPGVPPRAEDLSGQIEALEQRMHDEGCDDE